MAGKEYSFPIRLKNNLNMVMYVGNLRFDVGETKTINSLIYSRNEKSLDEIIGVQNADGVVILELMPAKSKSASPKVKEKVESKPHEVNSADVIPDKSLVEESINEIVDEVIEEEVKEDNEETAEESVMAQYASNKIHWRKATGIIQGIRDVEDLKALYEEGKQLHVDEGSAVMKAIVSEVRARGLISH